MIYTVTVNPCLDVIKNLEVEEHEDPAVLRSGTIRPVDPIRDELMRPGGKGLDVSRALRCLLVESKALGFIGDQTGKTLLGMLLAEGIDSDFVETGIETRTNIILSVTKKGDGNAKEVRLNSPGKEVPPNKYHLLYERCSTIRDATAVAICGSLSHGMQAAFYNSLIREFKKSSPGCVIVLDGPHKATVETLYFNGTRPTFIKPNLEEFDELLGVLEIKGIGRLLDEETRPQSVPKEDYLEYLYTGSRSSVDLSNSEITKCDDKEIRSNWSKLLEAILYIKEEYDVSVLLSLGPWGCVSIDNHRQVQHAYYSGEVGPVISRVGAGDSLVAGFLQGYCDTHGDLGQSLQRGIATAIARITEDERKTGRFLGIETYKRVILEGVTVDTYFDPSDFNKAYFVDSIDDAAGHPSEPGGPGGGRRASATSKRVSKTQRKPRTKRLKKPVKD